VGDENDVIVPLDLGIFEGEAARPGVGGEAAAVAGALKSRL